MRAEDFLALARQLWASWRPDDIVADAVAGEFVRRTDVGDFAFSGKQFDVSGRFTVPRSPQRGPVILQAGVSSEGREFATGGGSDAIFSPFHTLAEAQPFYRDIQARSVQQSRPAGATKVLPGAVFVLGDTEVEAVERHREITLAQISGHGAQILLETVWNRDLSGYDPDGPLPDVDPDPTAPLVI